MIINDFASKIKDKHIFDTFTIMCLLIITSVGIISFGLGRLSVKDDFSDNNNQLSSVVNNNSVLLNDNKVGDSYEEKEEKKYVASKNGKLYYSVGCSGAKRISEKNMIWFGTAEEAQKSGYEFASSCR